MLKLRVLTSFTYHFKEKVHHFQAHEFYHLFGDKDAEEIVFILSPGSPYRKYFRVESTSASLDSLLPDSTTNQYTQAELNKLPYTKIQEIADSLGIEYTNKKDTIDVILESQKA